MADQAGLRTIGFLLGSAACRPGGLGDPHCKYRRALTASGARLSASALAS
jgi:hypothetical protein